MFLVQLRCNYSQIQQLHEIKVIVQHMYDRRGFVIENVRKQSKVMNGSTNAETSKKKSFKDINKQDKEGGKKLPKEKTLGGTSNQQGRSSSSR